MQWLVPVAKKTRWPSVSATVKDLLVIDLLGDGVGIIPQQESSVFFDMTGDGALNHVSWITPDDGFLVRSRKAVAIV